MSNTVEIYVEDIDSWIADFDQIRLFRDTSPTGSFSTVVATQSLVADTRLYTFDDATGDATHWYAYYFRNSATTAVTSLSTPFQSTGLTLRKLRIEVAQDAGVGFKSECSAAGTVSTLVDVALLDSGVDSMFLEGAWVYRPGAASGDRLRRVKSFNTTTGAITPTRDWGSAPTDGEEYHVFLLIPPVDTPGGQSSYDRVIRSALNQAWYEDTVIVGDGTTDGKRRYDISPWKPWAGKIHKVIYRRFDPSTGYAKDRHANRDGLAWRIEENGHDAATLILSQAPGKDEQVMLGIYRTADPLYQDDDVTRVPFDYAIAWGKYELFRQLSEIAPGKYTGEVSAAEANLERLGRRYKPATKVVVG